MSKKRYWDIRIKEGRHRRGYSVPVVGGLKQNAIRSACVSGLITEGDCEDIESATEITEEQYKKMLGQDRVKQEILQFKEEKHEEREIIRGKEIVHEEWIAEVDVRANSMSEAKRLAWREVYNKAWDKSVPKKKLKVDCNRIDEHMFRCRSRI